LTTGFLNRFVHNDTTLLLASIARDESVPRRSHVYLVLPFILTNTGRDGFRSEWNAAVAVTDVVESTDNDRVSLAYMRGVGMSRKYHS
jgi:hypothetical protein